MGMGTSPTPEGCGLRRRHATASWTYLLRIIKLLSPSLSPPEYTLGYTLDVGSCYQNEASS